MAHYYLLKDGVPSRYIQLTKDGRESKRIDPKRAAADGALLGLTDLLKVLGDAGGLIRWAAGHGIEAGVEAGIAEWEGWANHAMPDADRSIAQGEARLDAIAAAWESWDERTTAAADAGTTIHDAVDAYLKGGPLPEDPIHATAAQAVKGWLLTQGADAGATEHCVIYRGRLFPELYPEIAFGGTADYIAENLIADWKTVENRAKGGYRKPYAKECAQLAGYRMAAWQMGLAKPTARCVNLYIDRATGEIASVREWTEPELAKGLAMVHIAAQVRDIIETLEG